MRAVSLGKVELVHTHSITKDNRLPLFFHRCLPSPNIFMSSHVIKVKAQLFHLAKSTAIRILWFRCSVKHSLVLIG